MINVLHLNKLINESELVLRIKKKNLILLRLIYIIFWHLNYLDFTNDTTLNMTKTYSNIYENIYLTYDKNVTESELNISRMKCNSREKNKSLKHVNEKIRAARRTENS